MHISINVSAWGGDKRRRCDARQLCVSIHAPRVGGDLSVLSPMRMEGMFQSTPPGVGGDAVHNRAAAARAVFQSTPPAWGATRGMYVTLRQTQVSIHAPRVGGDPARGAAGSWRRRFNPRPPRGGRPGRRSAGWCRSRFNPRPPRGGRQSGHPLPRSPGCFNPRPPRGGRPS